MGSASMTTWLIASSRWYFFPQNLKTSKNASKPQGPAGHGFGMRLNDRGVRAKMLLKLGVWRLGMLGLGQRRWSFKVCGGKR